MGREVKPRLMRRIEGIAMPGDPVSKRQFMETIRRDRERFDAIIAEIPRERLEEPRLGSDEWTVKDVLWHIAWGDRQNEGVIRARALVGSDMWQLPEHERNAAVVNEGRSRSLDDVLDEYRRSHVAFVSALEGVTESDLSEPADRRGFVERAPGWLTWRILYDPGHYELHGRWIKERLAP